MNSSKRTLKNKLSTQKNKKDKILSDIIRTLLCILNTVKIYHWNTDDYSTHKATDKLYDELNDKIDKFVEIMLGKVSTGTKHKLLNVKSLTIHNFTSNQNFKKETEKNKDFLINLSNEKMLNIPENSDLMNVRDEILGDLNQFLYLLNLH